MNDPFGCTDEDWDVMSRFLSALARGETHDHVTPLVGNSAEDPDCVRGLLADEVWSVSDLDRAPPWLQEAEREHRKKLGSSSRRLPYWVARPDGGVSLEAKFERFFAPRVTRINGKAALFASQQVAAMWPRARARLRVMPLEDAVCLRKKGTNFGYPRCTSSFEDNLHYYYLESVRLREQGYPLADASDYPSIATTRSQAAGENLWAKDRALSMYCGVLTGVEKGLQKVGFDALRDHETFCAWKGQDAVDRAVTRLLDGAPGAVLSADFTNFDASVPNEVITRVFDVMASWFERETRPQIAFVCEAFMRSGIYLPGRDGTIEYRHGSERTGGVPSGSGLTNWIDSLANCWVFHYAAHRLGGSISRILVNGDDAVVAFHKVSDFAAVSDVMMSELGMLIKMDPDKNLVSKEAVRYLKMEHHKAFRIDGLYRGLRPLNRALIGMTGRERRVPKGWHGWMNIYRWLQQIEPCMIHPGVEGFLLWFVDKTEDFLYDALRAIWRGDEEVAFACSLVSGDDEERGILSLRGLRKSKVVRRLSELCGVSPSDW